jgi:nitrogen-specific signal transduction histidine kinase
LVNQPDYKGKIKFITADEPANLSIEDNGIGISKENADQLFTPFYSSKRDGQGIGLTVIREILNSHRFKFSLKSIDETTTRFQIFFNSSPITVVNRSMT